MYNKILYVYTFDIIYYSDSLIKVNKKYFPTSYLQQVGKYH
jgi:hypothetical protein